MALKSNFNQAASLRDLQAQAEKIHQRIIAAFHMAGLKFIKAVRSQPGGHPSGFYDDQTTNLRNSTQYFILYDGEVIEQYDSQFTGLNLAEIESNINRVGYQLIGIAGMNYASAVESKGYNVITQQRDQCIIDLTTYFKEIQKYIDRQ
jgi:hypothetical protein